MILIVIIIIQQCSDTQYILEIAALFILLLISTYSAALSDIEDSPYCIKLNGCSCTLTGVEKPGVIDLHSLVSGKHEPASVARGGAYFYYNPCMNFSNYQCPNTSICQQSFDKQN